MDTIDRTLLQCSLEYHGSQLLDALREEQGENFVLPNSTARPALVVPMPVVNIPLPPSPPPTTPVQCSSSTAADLQILESPIEVINNVRQSQKDSVKESRRKLLVSFIAKKADMLFRKVDDLVEAPVMNELEYKDHYGIVPPVEYFMDVDEEARKQRFYQTLRKGDIVFGSVFGKHTHGLLIRLLCLSGGRMLYIHDLDLRCFCNVSQIPLRSAHEDPLEAYDVNDLVQGVVLEVQELAQKIYISMKDAALLPELHQKYKLGLMVEDSLPIHYRECLSAGSKRYSEMLEDAHGFSNPNTVSHMALMLGLDLSCSPSLMRGLHMKKYPKEDYASVLYKIQCARWAYKSVEEGVRYFKSGNKVEAFQCLNKALQIDPFNVEALVARGALFANNSSFKRALEDFYKAIDQNPKHANALKYTVETLIALGKQYEEQNNVVKVSQCYEKALQLNPLHTEATDRLSAFREKVQGLERDKARQIALESEEIASSSKCDTKQRLKQLLSSEKTGKQEHRHASKRRNSSTSSDTSENSKSRRRRHRRRNSGTSRSNSTSSFDSSRSSRSRSKSSSMDRRRSSRSSRGHVSKRRRKSRNKRRSRKKYRRKRRHSDSSSTTSSSSSSTVSLSSGSMDVHRDKSRATKAKSKKAGSDHEVPVVDLAAVKPPTSTLKIGRQFREVIAEPKQTANNNFPFDANRTTDVPLTSVLVVAESNEVRPPETSNKNGGGSDGQSLQELESFLAALKAKQSNRLTKIR